MYMQDRHFALSGKKWDDDRAGVVVQEIVEDAVVNLNRGYLWPTHPLDDDTDCQGLYFSTGVSWALEYFRREGVVDVEFDAQYALSQQLQVCQHQYSQMPHCDNSSYLLGDVPILMMLYRLSSSTNLLDEIQNKITLNNTQPTRELMWGTAGTMIALSHLQRWLPNEPRWVDLYVTQAQRLIEELEQHNEFGYLWMHDVYGNNTYYLGPVHGASGNSLALIKGRQNLAGEEYRTLCEKIMAGIIKTAVTDNNFTNWPAIAGQLDNLQLHHCRGAPGIINALSELPVGINHEFDNRLLKAGELIWAAGPLKKGLGLCHGTAGNGFALLKLFERTQDESWLDRAKVFAMEAIEQYQNAKALFHQGRYSLWNGDMGLAIFLDECRRGTARFPTVDTF